MKYRFRDKWADVPREQKAKARNVFSGAVARGDVVRPSNCEDCGIKPRVSVHGHHEDYSKPLDVKWLCPKCHKKRHSTPIFPRHRTTIKVDSKGSPCIHLAKCLRCDFHWYPRKVGLPRICPSCKSPHWNSIIKEATA